MWGAISDDRIGLSLQLLLAVASAVIPGSEPRVIHDHILLFHIRDSPNLEGQVPVFISPSERVAQLYPQALGSLSVASYDSQGYGGGILGLFEKLPNISWQTEKRTLSVTPERMCQRSILQR
jgi:hypothetical protein